MASFSKNEIHNWVDRVKSEGGVPISDPKDCSNGCWAIPPADIFLVRGPQYLSNKSKIPANEFLLRPLGFDWIKAHEKLSELLDNPNHRIRKALDDEDFPAGHDKPFIWAFNFQIPSDNNYNIVAYFASLEPIPEGSLMDQFLKGNGSFRDSRLKLITSVVQGPWILKKAIGENGICLIGKALECRYCLDDDFVEVDIDVGSSMIATAIARLGLGYLSLLTVDLAFLIESKTELELPERILGAVRFSELNTASAKLAEQPCNASTSASKASLHTRLWKSLGHGFSSLVHPGDKESGSLGNTVSNITGFLSDGEANK